MRWHLLLSHFTIPWRQQKINIRRRPISEFLTLISSCICQSLLRSSHRRHVGIFYHVSGVPWLIIMGFRLDDWIYWRFYYNYSSLQSFIAAHNRWLPKTRSIPTWTASVFPSTVTDLVLIYESVTSSASVVRWLTLHSWTPNFWILLQLTHDGFSLTNESRINYMPFYNSVQNEDKTLLLTVHSILGVSIPRQRRLSRMCLAKSVREPLPSNGLFRLSGFLTHSLSWELA
jgi:hypothetical protein